MVLMEEWYVIKYQYLKPCLKMHGYLIGMVKVRIIFVRLGWARFCHNLLVGLTWVVGLLGWPVT